MNLRGEGPPFPNPSLAFTLAATAMFVSTLVVPILAKGSIIGVAIGAVLGLGGFGVLAAQRVPEPAAQRLGLAPFPLRALAPMALLLPAVLLVSEIDNWVRIAFSAKPSATLGVASVAPLETILLGVFLSPVLEEFFFRGVLLQGCVSALGRVRAVLYVAALQVVLVPSIAFLDAFSGSTPSTAALVSQAVGTVLMGIVYGSLRLATGSLLPGIALSGAVAALGFAAGAFPDRIAIPGFNAPGATTPLAMLVPAAASVAAGAWLLLRQLERAPALPPIPQPAPEDDEEPGGLF
jgi:membrane protease YdiL (CAAX protease family)